MGIQQMLLGSSDNTIGYIIANSLRFRGSSSPMLTRTPSSNGTSTKGTLSTWVKYSGAGIYGLMGCRIDANNFFMLGMSQNQFGLWMQTAGSWRAIVFTNSVRRDPSAWYHVVIHFDTSGTTGAGNYLKVYVNGELQTLNVNITPNGSVFTGMNSTTNQMQIGYGYSASYLDGYLAEYHWLDGIEKQASDFGEFNSDGVWIPKAYSGAYGTNGFYLKFNDGSNLTNLCLDRSGNGNNWAATNISLTAGATYDWMVDSPTNNFAVLNPLNRSGSSYSTSFGNLRWSGSASVQDRIYGSIGISAGKFYWECTTTTFGTNGDSLAHYAFIGVARNVFVSGDNYDRTGFWYIGELNYSNLAGYKQDSNSSTNTAYGTNFGQGNTIGVAIDKDSGTLEFFLNGVSQGIAFTNLNSYAGPYFPCVFPDGSSTVLTVDFNFGQRPFLYTPPAGFKSLCTANMNNSAIANSSLHFKTLLSVGDGSLNRTFNGVGFAPDFVWQKSRSSAISHWLIDSVRGAAKNLQADNSLAEITTGGAGGALNQVESDGFSILAGSSNSNNVNKLNDNYVAWCWKAGGAAVTNNSGSVTSQVSANATAGFSIVTYTGTLSSAGTFTVGHGLGRPPAMIITKARNASADWSVMHAFLPSWNHAVFLNSTTGYTDTSTWGNRTAPSSTVFTANYVSSVGVSGHNHIGYCFAEVDGFSKFGSFTGNGSSDGPFVYCGFRPRLIMYKGASINGTSWIVIDTARSLFNVSSDRLLINTTDVESSGIHYIDITSNGFKVRNTDTNGNNSGSTYIFAAFAETPFGGANVSPGPAR